MGYIIQAGGPPSPKRHGGAPRKYLFQELQVNEWFFAPDAKRGTMASLANFTGKRMKRIFQTRFLYMRFEKGAWTECEPDHKDARAGVAVYRTA